jgi:hypothetical protein
MNKPVRGIEPLRKIIIYTGWYVLSPDLKEFLENLGWSIVTGEYL